MNFTYNCWTLGLLICTVSFQGYGRNLSNVLTCSYTRVKVTIRLTKIDVPFLSHILSATHSLISSMLEEQWANIHLEESWIEDALWEIPVWIAATSLYKEVIANRLGEYSHFPLCWFTASWPNDAGPKVESGDKNVVLQLPLKHIGIREKNKIYNVQSHYKSYFPLVWKILPIISM